MNIRQLKYALQLAEIRNFSQLAEKLSISQPALSKQIKSIEDELGVKIFDRDTSPLSLTPAGEQFIVYAKKLIYEEEQLLSTMEKFQNGEAGRIKIGISPFRSMCLIPQVIKRIKEKYPRVQITLHEDNSTNIKKEIADGKYDFAILNLPVDDSVLDIFPLQKDILVLAVPNCLLGNISNLQSNLSDTIDLKDCKNLPFITVGRSQELRNLFDRLCASADLHPNISVEVNGGIATARALMLEGIGATILPLNFIKDHPNTTLFNLRENVLSRQPVVAVKKGQYLSEFAKYAISIITEEM